jgi:hypothetical protein
MSLSAEKKLSAADSAANTTDDPALDGAEPESEPAAETEDGAEESPDDSLDDGDGDADDVAPDFSERELCIDGACIGVIGSDGRCRECGKQGENQKTTGDSAHVSSASETSSNENASLEEDPSWAQDVDPNELDFGSRRLCSNGACVGVIGSNNECKDCGRPYSGEWHENEEVVEVVEEEEEEEANDEAEDDPQDDDQHDDQDTKDAS